MFLDLNTDGLVGPFELNQMELINRLIRQLDIADGQFKNLHTSNKTTQSLLSATELKVRVEQYFGEELSLWRTNCFRKTDGSGEVEWHHDRHLEDGDSQINFLNLSNHFSILVALTDMNEASGVMEFIPGSHLPQDGYIQDIRPFHMRTLGEHFLHIPRQLLKKGVKVPLKKGQFLLFHSGLLHRSLPAHGTDINRYSLVARLCNNSTIVPEALAIKENIHPYPYIHEDIDEM